MKFGKYDNIVYGALILSLFIYAFYLYTLPIQENPLPFGEHDGFYIFSYGDRMSYYDHSSDIVGDSPVSILFWYANWNFALGPTTLEYPPPYLMGYAFAQVFGGERIVPAFLYIALFAISGSLAAFFIMRRLYGIDVGIITAIGFLFSIRVVMTYMWGQRHNLTALFFVPVGLYSLYRYLSGIFKGEERPVYFYLFILMLLASYMTHMGGAVLFIPGAGVMFLLFWAKYGKLPIKRGHIKHYIIGLFLMVAIVSQFWLIYFGANSTFDADYNVKDLYTIFKWFNRPPDDFQINPAYIDYDANYVSPWTVVPLILGLFVMLMRRKDRDIFLLSGLAGIYINYHLPMLGLLEWASPRVARSMVVENFFFFATMGIGICLMPFLLPIKKLYRVVARYSFAAVFIIILFATIGQDTYGMMKNAYQPPLRISQEQYDLAEWIDDNTDKYSAFNIHGPLSYPKWRAIQILSRRVMLSDTNMSRRDYRAEDLLRDDTLMYEPFRDGNDMAAPINYVILDYTDPLIIGNKHKIEEMQEMEQELAGVAQVIHDQRQIKVYEYDEKY